MTHHHLPDIPTDRWNPLSVEDVTALFASAPFSWCLAGGYAVEQFLGHPLRAHGDIDIIIFRDDQLTAQQWLHDWHLFAADKGQNGRFLRRWQPNEFLPVGIHDIWAHSANGSAWQLQLMIQESADNYWYFRRNPTIKGPQSSFICNVGNIPCIRIEIQLLYKSQDIRPKDEIDFQACLPHLTSDAIEWLARSLKTHFPNGHQWLPFL